MNRVFRLISDAVKGNAMREIKSMPIGKYEIIIRPVKRSLPQNAYYWALVKVVSDETGYTPEEWHEAFKRNFIGQEQGVDMFGNVYIMPKSSASLSKADFQEYLIKVQSYIEGQGYAVPPKSYFGG